MTKKIQKSKAVNSWFSFRISDELRERLTNFQLANRRPTASDTVRLIIEDRLNKEEGRVFCNGCRKYVPKDEIEKVYKDGSGYCEICVSKD